jgi:conjugal transfer pilus assembly protein TraF
MIPRVINCLFSGVLALSVTASSFASNSQKAANTEGYNPAVGYHFYDKPEVIEKIADKVVEKLMQSASSTSKAEDEQVGSSAWLKKHLPGARRLAADEPTVENIRALLLMEKMLRDKGMRLARRAAMISQTDPVLDTSYMPTTNIAMSRDRKGEISRNQKSLVKELVRNGVSLWVFIKGDCSKCERMVSTMAKLTEDYGFRVLWIIEKGIEFPTPPEATDRFWEYRQANGEAEKVGLKSNMGVYAYHSKTKEFVLVSQGFVPVSSFPRKLIVSADYSGWVTPDQVDSTMFGVNNHDLSNPPTEGFSGDHSNPTEYANYLYNQLLMGK